ncbi:MAG: PAS domain S-box protein [Bryobacterales bacterium]
MRSELEAAAHDQARGLFAARLRTLEEDREKAVAELEQAYAELEASHEQLQIAVSEREAAELQARDERDFVEAVLDAAHALVVVMDRAGRILRFNRACERAAGRRLSEIRGGLVWNLIPADQRGRVQKVFDDLLAGRYPNQFENEWRRKDGSRVRVSWSNTVLTNAAGSVTHVIGVGIDVTEQRKAEAALRDSDARNLALVEAAPLGIVAIDRSNRIQAVNQALERMFGYERAELLGRTLGMLLPKRFRRIHRGHQESFFEHPVSRPMGVNMSLFGLAKDGREFPIEVGLGHFEATGGPYAVAFVTDVTEKIRAHEMIEKNRDEIRDLAARLMTAREEEQRRIARDLHDGLVQDLVAVKLDLAVLARNPAITAAGVLDDVKRAEEEVRLVAETARTISHELHPAVLDRLGLVPALRSNAAEVQRATGIEVRVEADDPVAELPRRTALGLYRIAQEALWNAVKHSGTDSVTIAVRTAPDDELVLEVTDHGKGFDLADVRRGRSLGLVSMEERTRLIGGNLELQAQPGGGTVVRVRLERNASADRHPGMSELPSKS